MTDKVLAVFSLVILICFCGILIWFVPSPDLAIISLIVLAMAFYDFYITSFRKKTGAQ